MYIRISNWYFTTKTYSISDRSKIHESLFVNKIDIQFPVTLETKLNNFSYQTNRKELTEYIFCVYIRVHMRNGWRIDNDKRWNITTRFTNPWFESRSYVHIIHTRTGTWNISSENLHGRPNNREGFPPIFSFRVKSWNIVHNSGC